MVDPTSAAARPFLRERVALLLVVILTHAWTTGLWFALDDFDFLPDAATLPGNDSYLMGGRPPLAKGATGPAFAFVIRPTLHLALWLDQKLFGTSAPLLHASSVAYHLLAVFLLFALAARCMPADSKRRTAFVAALIFAVHPAKLEAVSWISTRGDLLIGLFALVGALTLYAHRRSPRRWKLASFVLATAAAVGAKESGIIVPFLLIAFDVFFLGRATGIDVRTFDRRRFGAWTAAIAVGAGYLLWRRLRLGDDMLLYGGRASITDWRALVDMMRALPETLTNFSGGLFLSLDQPLPILIGAIATGILVVGGLFARDGRASGNSGLIALFLVALAPSLRFLADSAAVDLSRLFYLSSIPFSVLLARSITSLFATRARLIAWITVVALVAACSWSFVLAAITHREAARRARSFVDAVVRNAATLPSGTWQFVKGGDAAYRGAPMVANFLAQACRPPFQAQVHQAQWIFTDPGFVVETMGIAACDGPAVFCLWDAEQERLEVTSPILQAPAPLPERRVLGSTNRVDLDVPPRTISVVTVETESAAAGGEIDVAFEFGDGRRHVETLVSLAPWATRAERTIVVLDKPWFILEPRLRSIELVARDGAPRPVAVRFASRPDVIEIRSPSHGDRIAAGADLVVEIGGAESYRLLSLELVAGARTSWFFGADVLEREGDRTFIDLGRTTEDPRLGVRPGWQSLAPFIERHLEGNSLAFQDAWIRVFGHDGDPRHPTAYSTPLRIRLVR